MLECYAMQPETHIIDWCVVKFDSASTKKLYLKGLISSKRINVSRLLQTNICKSVRLTQQRVL